LVFKRIGGLFMELGETEEFAERRAASAGFANNCEDRSEGLMKWVVGGDSTGSEAPSVASPLLVTSEDELAGKAFNSVSLSSSISKAEVESVDVWDIFRKV
jgi:hypothetical protein